MKSQELSYQKKRNVLSNDLSKSHNAKLSKILRVSKDNAYPNAIPISTTSSICKEK